MTPAKEINTKRLQLTSVTPALIHKLFASKTKKEIATYFGVEEDGYAKLSAMHEAGMESYQLSLFYFLLRDKDSKRPIGECGFHTWNKTHNRAELFYSLRNDIDKRKGLMTEAVKEILAYGFQQLALHRIEALVASSNTPSIKLLERHGFTKEGTMREDYLTNGVREDSDCYSLLKREWENNNILPANILF